MTCSLAWTGDALLAVDQRALPEEYRQLRLGTVDEVIDAIRRLAVRGAPAIGVAGAFGVALSARRHTRDGGVDTDAVAQDAERLIAARPTAVNLPWAVERVLRRLPAGPDAVLSEAQSLLGEDERTNGAAAAHAADLLVALCGDRPLRIATHCNTGRLATVSRGTALGAIADLHERGRVATVLAGETRPLLQGARLTAWELAEGGIDHRLCVDAALPAAIARELVDCVVVGADRVAGNGDVANKIGTYALAVAAARQRIPFVVVAPESTIDRSIAGGDEIEIEERAAAEVLELRGQRIAPAGTPAYNPAFDVTPAELVTAVVSERGVVRDLDDGAALAARVGEHLRSVPDFPAPGVGFADLAGVYGASGLLSALAAHLAGAAAPFDVVAAVEARGFPLGAAIAAHASKPLVLVRKPGKLPGETLRCDYACEYRSDALEVQEDGIAPGSAVLVVDDVLATGGTLAAAETLVARSGASVAAFAVILELNGLGGRDVLGGDRVRAVRRQPA